MEHERLGPPPEWAPISRRQDTEWWKILTGIFREEQADIGAIRPAFSDRANRYLKTNGSRNRAQ